MAVHFAAEAARAHDRPISAISARALDQLQKAAWPGNVRELRNVMDRAVLLTTGDTILTGALRLGRAAPRASSVVDDAGPAGYPLSASLAEVELDHIRRVLESVDGQINKAATILGVHRNTLAKKVRLLGRHPS